MELRGQTPLNSAQWEVWSFIKDANSGAADRHQFMRSFGEVQHVAARNSYDHFLPLPTLSHAFLDLMFSAMELSE